MILYHGSMMVIDQPRILSRPDGRGADFGIGFYTTSSHAQAVKWVNIRQRGLGEMKHGYVSRYEVPDNLLRLPDLKTRSFTNANRAWLHFVRANRNVPDFSHAFDIVFGPVANDRVYTTLTLWEGGFLDEEQTIERLKTYKLANQYLFHTEKALPYLKFINAEEIE